MPADHQKIVADTFDAQALEQRTANQKLDASLEDVLKKQGMEFVKPDRGGVPAALTKSGFYKTWQGKFGAPLWAALEKVTGPLGLKRRAMPGRSRSWRIDRIVDCR